MSETAKFFRETGTHGHYDTRFYRGGVDDAVRRRCQIELLTVLVAHMAEYHAAPILMHGGLIGWFWNKSMLPWDTDIDVCIPFEDLRRMANQPTRQKHWKYLWEINPQYLNRDTQNQKPADSAEPNKIDARLIDPATGLFIDITALAELTHGFVSTKCPHHYAVEQIFPNRRDSFEGVPICVPNNVEAVLVQEYGAGSVRSDRYGQYCFDSQVKQWLPVA